MDFSDALELLKTGKDLSRKGWNGKDMFIFLAPDMKGEFILCREHIEIQIDKSYSIPWTPSQSDLFADDWYIF